MARRTLTWTQTAEGRDKGKAFLITEMPSDQAERWALRAAFALVNGKVDVPDSVLNAGLAGIASMAHIMVWTLRSLQGIRHADVDDLLDELMGCVQFVPFGVASSTPVPLLNGPGGQIEEVLTRLQLKVQAFQVHVDFSLADALSNFRRSQPGAESQQLGQSA